MIRSAIRALGSAGVLAACLVPAVTSAATVHAPNVVNVTPGNFATVFPGQLNAGTLTLRLTTPGKDGTSVSLAQLHPGASRTAAAQALRTGKAMNFLMSVRLVGGVDSVGGQTRVGLFSLPAGTYVAFSLDQLTAQKNPHSPYRFFTVTGNAQAAPSSVGQITALDFRFRLPGAIPAGNDTIHFVNSGKEPHELDLVRVDNGKTMADVKKALMANSNQTPSWIHTIGGWGVVSPGSSMWVRANLVPGQYLLMCWVPDMFSYPGHKPTNKPHVMLGMVKMIQVH